MIQQEPNTEIVKKLSGDKPYPWGVKVYKKNGCDAYFSVAIVGSWHSRTDDVGKEKEALDAGCTRMADMCAQVEEMINA